MYPSLTPQRERYLLLTLAGIQFSHILDFMIMMPLGPILIKALGIGTHQFGLLVASYSFSAAISGLLATTFVDKFERKRLLLVVFTLFGLATLACGLAPSFVTLLVARGLAGTFGGVMGAMVQTMVGDLIPFERRARASSILMTAFSISTIAGVPLSLWLANHFGWRAPFIVIAGLTIVFFAIGLRTLPEVRQHISTAKETHPFVALFSVLRDVNHLRALLFTALIMFSGFTVIPYITIYAVGNVGITQQQIPLLYLVGGAATLISARLIGYWADLHGKVKIYRWVATGALLPLFLVTHSGVTPFWLWLIFTTLFFVLLSGRMIPAMAIITSAAQPRLRGTFMALNASIQQLASGMASVVAGFIISQNSAAQIIGYNMVGYVAIAANLLAIWYVARISLRDVHGTDSVLDVAVK